MDLQSILNSPFGVGLAVFIGKVFPPKFGYSIAELGARWISRQKNSMQVRSVRANQWIVSGKKLNSAELDDITFETFSSTAKCLFDLYCNLSKREKIIELVDISPKIRDFFESDQIKNAVFVAPHVSNFDLAGRAIALSGFKLLALSYPQPGEGYKWQNKMREDYDLEIMPLSFKAFQAAKKRLRDGGSIVTGLDRPVADEKYKPMFFGKPGSLPVAYTRLALEANAPVIVISAITRSDNSYGIIASDPIHMKPHSNLHTETIQNAEAVLKVTEEIIKKNPSQWSMFYPVWPDALDEMP
ncbi:MAG: lysophospholipid acyltransferase family protein [Anaerolineaceae bacterium]|nr:lysophospholipid acyltransferase family protein [Anaerolineaceae bacterium]